MAKCDSDGRAAIINLGTMMNGLTAGDARQVPADLVTVPYDHPRMIQRFAKLWDKISEILARPQFMDMDESGRVRSTAEWIISIGNEIDLYLDNPDQGLPGGVDGVDDVDRIDGTAAEAWASYRSFYEKAQRYVVGGRVDLTGDGEPDPNLSNRSFIRHAGFTTTWRACSPGWRVAHEEELSGEDPPCTIRDGEAEIRADFLNMAGRSQHWIYTRYIPFAGRPPESPTDSFFDEVKRDFGEMAAVAKKAQQEGFMKHVRPIVIQEMGYPSSVETPTDNRIADQQTAFVEQAVTAWGVHNAEQGPTLRQLWQQLVDG